MKDYILQRKIARIIALIAERENISQPQALVKFYQNKACKMLHNPEMQLHIMSDLYIVDEYYLQAEQQNSQSTA